MTTWRWLARATFFLYCTIGIAFLPSLEAIVLGLLYLVLFVLAFRTVLLLQALGVLSLLCLAFVSWLLPEFWLLVFGLPLGVAGLLWLQMHNPRPKTMALLEVEYGC
jgi:hypothetical protein